MVSRRSDSYKGAVMDTFSQCFQSFQAGSCSKLCRLVRLRAHNGIGVYTN